MRRSKARSKKKLGIHLNIVDRFPQTLKLSNQANWIYKNKLLLYSVFNSLSRWERQPRKRLSEITCHYRASSTTPTTHAERPHGSPCASRPPHAIQPHTVYGSALGTSPTKLRSRSRSCARPDSHGQLRKRAGSSTAADAARDHTAPDGTSWAAQHGRPTEPNAGWPRAWNGYAGNNGCRSTSLWYILQFLSSLLYFIFVPPPHPLLFLTRAIHFIEQRFRQWRMHTALHLSSFHPRSRSLSHALQVQ